MLLLPMRMMSLHKNMLHQDNDDDDDSNDQDAECGGEPGLRAIDKSGRWANYAMKFVPEHQQPGFRPGN
jgi:hypothetical protein